MYSIYNLVSGPLAWLAFIIFFGGSLYKIYSLILLTREKEKFIFSFMSLKYSMRSILHWIIPFGSLGWRSKPILTLVTFGFHICLITAPIFLLSHIVLWDESLGISWAALSGSTADVMTLIVISGCIFYLIRRVTQKEVKFVTSASDFVLLAIVAAPFVTGFLAYHQTFAYQTIMTLHIISGEIMLVMIPFTRLSHMLLSPLTRAYMGSEFGGIRHARDY